jgi:Zinc finger, ZZ type
MTELGISPDGGVTIFTCGYMDVLKQAAVGLFLGMASVPYSDFLQDYSVALFYKDLENDKIVIVSDTDICYALTEYKNAEQRSVKIFAVVSAVPKMMDAASVATQTANVTTEDKGTKTEDKNVVDALSDLLSIAAVSMEAGVNAALSKEQLRTAKKLSKDSIKAAKTVTKDSFKAAKAASRDSFNQARNSVRNVMKAGTDTVAAVTSTAVHAEGPDCRPVPVCKDPPVDTDAPKDTAAATSPEISPELPFIHGRHTCDQCLTTPVVGKRFHATNLPDYDLCEACFGDYKGTEIKFEEAKLGKYYAI